MNASLIQFYPSGNWCQNFHAIGTTMVAFDYCDRRRNGQVARHYLITFKPDSYEVVDIMAVSANGGRVEHFSTCRMLETAKGILRKARIEAFEAEFEAEVEAIQAAKAEKAKKEAEEQAKAERLENILFVASIVAIVVIAVVLWNVDPYALLAVGLPLIAAAFILGVWCTVAVLSWITDHLKK